MPRAWSVSVKLSTFTYKSNLALFLRRVRNSVFCWVTHHPFRESKFILNVFIVYIFKNSPDVLPTRRERDSLIIKTQKNPTGGKREIAHNSSCLNSAATVCFIKIVVTLPWLHFICPHLWKNLTSTSWQFLLKTRTTHSSSLRSSRKEHFLSHVFIQNDQAQGSLEYKMNAVLI